MFSLWNDTDQVFAAPYAFETEQQAEAYAAEFRKQYATQGYYLTADGFRVPPDEVELIVVAAED